MRRAALALTAIAVITLLVSGCGKKIESVPATVAKVNGTPIDYVTYLDQVSRRQGQEVLKTLIEQQVVLQWAKEEGVSPTEAQVAELVKFYKDQGAYEDQVKALGEKNAKAEYEALQARINLAKKLSKIPPQQLKQMYDATKQIWVHGPRKQIAAIVNVDSTKLDEALKKIKEGGDYDDAAMEFGVGGRGPIKIWIDSTKSQGIPAGILKVTKETKVGETSKVISFSLPSGPSQFAIVKVLAEQPKESKSFEQAKGQLENLAGQQASQMDPVFMSKLNDKLKDAKIDVEIKEFKGLVYQLKNPQMPMMPAPQGRPMPPKAR